MNETKRCRCDFCLCDIHDSEKLRCNTCARMFDDMQPDGEQLSEVDIESRLWDKYCNECFAEDNCVDTKPQECHFVRAEYGDEEAINYLREIYGHEQPEEMK